MRGHSIRFFSWWTLIGLLCVSSSAWAQAQKALVTLKDGTRIGPGIIGEHATLSTDPLQRGQTETMSLSIKSIDDDLRLTYFHQARIANLVPSTLLPEEIVLPSASEVQSGAGQFVVRNVVQVQEFNKYGRRIYSIEGGREREDLLQGLTHITPLYSRVQTLRETGAGARQRPWDQRIATSSIPPAKLREILHHELDMNSPQDRLRIVRFFIQAERYPEARVELVEALEKFPEQLAEQRGLLVSLESALINKMFNEIDLRRRSGQPAYAVKLSQMLGSQVAGDALIDTQAAIQDQMDKLKATIVELSELVQGMKSQLAQISTADAEIVRPIIEQIEKELTVESQGRLADYKQFYRSTNFSDDQKLAFAIGGWLMGAGAGINNLEIAKSAIKVQALVHEYLTTASSGRREEIIEQLSKEEAGRPQMVGQIIAAMKPPLELPAQPEAAPPGLYRVELAATETSQATQYLVQLPPEYNPYRRYPCIVALPGLGWPLQMSIDWWCGPYSEQVQERLGIATRYGYIVIVPQWADDGQLQYNYTGIEHDRVLRSVRDAFRRLSIDTNRAFISGHFDGGAVAWDVALSHPDLWAGAVMMSPSSEKFIVMYGQNALHVPTYTVWGQFDGSNFKTNLGRTVSAYLRNPNYDAIGVEYKGRPRDHFLEETPRIMDWMEMSNHRRDPNPREINAEAARAGDRYFYWFEMPEIDADKLVSPYRFDMKRENKIEVKMQPAGNTIILSKYPAKSAWVWLRPGLVNFDQEISISGRGTSRKINRTFKGDVRILLEDVRTRGDRLAPFYDRVEL